MENISLEDAVAVILQHTVKITQKEKAALMCSLGRTLAENITADIDNPPFDRSPVDGYACRHEDIDSASRENPIKLKVLEEVDAGGYTTRTIKTGEAVRIMTGAPIPAGCVCCIRQEDTDYGENTVSVYTPSKRFANFCHKGEDFTKGTLLLPAGTKIGYAEAALLACLGLSEVPVYHMPRIALFTTGDEVTQPGRALLPGKIYDSNLVMLSMRLKELGAAPVITAAINDDPAAVTERLKSAATHCDLIITTGGVSVGKKDILHEALTLMGAERLFWRILLKPGSPMIFSTYNNIPIASLSGNLFSAMVNFELLIRPLLSEMTGGSISAPVRLEGIMADEFPKGGSMRRFIRAMIHGHEIRLPQSGRHASSMIVSLHDCNCLVDIPANHGPLKAHDKVSAMLLDV